ncbi:MAG: hypothetical protein SNJ70_02380 [Armatimonadota bacterium]
MNQKLKLLILLAFSALLCFGVISLANAQWLNSVKINQEGETNVKGCSLYGASDNGFYASYTSQQGMRFKRCYPNGTFSAAVVPATGTIFNINVAEAFNGDIHIVWEDWDNTNIPIGWARSTNGGASFSRTFVPNNNTKYPYIRPFGSSGSANMLVTAGSINYPNTGDNNIYYSVFNGASWSPSPTALANQTNSEYSLHGLATSPVDGSVWKIYNGRDTKMYIRRFNGISWDAPILIDGTSTFRARQDIAVNSLGEVFCLWSQDERTRMRIYSPSSGVSQLYSLDQNQDFARVVAIPNRADFYIIYTDNRASVWGKRYFQGVFSPAERVCAGLPDGFYSDTSLAVTPNGTLYAGFEYWQNGTPQWWYSKNTFFVGADTTPPIFNGPVNDGGPVQSISTYIYATWGEATDPESGVYSYQYSIGTSPGATNILGWTTRLATQSREMLHSHNYAPGTYYVNVRAINNVGLISNVVSSSGIQLTAPPNPATFVSAERVDSSSKICENVMLRKASSGGIHMVYDVDEPHVHYRMKNANGTWESAIGIGTGKFPDIVEASNGILYAIFNGSGARENNPLYENVKAGSSWAGPSLVYGGSMNWYPRLAAGDSGQVHLAGQRGRILQILAHLADMVFRIWQGLKTAACMPVGYQETI